jgi:23S rRNA (uridine2552-2'-O)-methyltransferase
MAHTNSSGRWLRRHVSDAYVQRAQKEGYRSRAAYKLEELDRADRLLRSGMTVVDLGAAPGGWSQYVVRQVGAGGRVLAVDVLPMKPIQGVEFIQGDFTDPQVLDSIRGRLTDAPADLVISDMAPNISGVAARDQAKAVYMAELALEFAAQSLKRGGNLVIKTFQGEGYVDLHRTMKRVFDKLLTRKPKASRAESREIYLLGKGFKGAESAGIVPLRRT